MGESADRTRGSSSAPFGDTKPAGEKNLSKALDSGSAGIEAAGGLYYYACMKKATTVEEYLAEVPEPQRSTLEKLRAMIRAAAPKEATEGISYGMPAFHYKGGLVAYASFKCHCTIFPMNGSLVEKFRDELGKYETSKGTIRFAVDKPLWAALVKARVAEKGKK